MSRRIISLCTTAFKTARTRLRMQQIQYRAQQRVKNGFTLLELLVVISIIGILMAMAAVAYSTAQVRARDARRRSDIDAIQQAFEQYYAANGQYINNCQAMAADEYLSGPLPEDPLGTPYRCDPVAPSEYCICATLESEGSGNSTDNDCAFAASGDFYCRVNRQ